LQDSAANRGRPAPGSEQGTLAAATNGEDAVIAWVNGRAVPRSRFNSLLRDSHGLFVLEQLVALEVVKVRATRENIEVTPKELEAEYNRALKEMARTAVSDDADGLRAAGEQMLERFLQDKNISLEEYRLGIERTAYMRKMVADRVQVSEDELRAEFSRRHGRQAVVRHIALPDLQAVADVRRRLEQGDDFAALARSYSLHRLSGSAGGLLAAFNRGDPNVPEVLRRAAFDLQPGQISDAVQINAEYHLIQLQRFIDVDAVSMSEPEADAVRRQMRDARFRREIQALEKQLFAEANIRIADPTLRRAFKARYDTQSDDGL
jgi:foldase protein PrsA